MMSGRADDYLEYLVNVSFHHILLETSFNVLATVQVTEKLNTKAKYNIKASSPMGLEASLLYSAHSSTVDSEEVTGDGTFDGRLQIGSLFTNCSYRHSYILHPLEREGSVESTLHLDSTLIHIHNVIQGIYTESELNILSKSNIQKDVLKQVAELNYKDSHLTIKSNTVSTVVSKLLKNNIELSVFSDKALLKIESKADKNKTAYSLITGSLDSNGLNVTSQGLLEFDKGQGSHQASVIASRTGLTTSGTSRVQFSPLTLENVFYSTVDRNGASLMFRSKARTKDHGGQLDIDGKVTAAEASLHCAFKGDARDSTSHHNVNALLNTRAWTFTSGTRAMMGQMKTESNNTLILTLWTLTLCSKTENFICEDIYYKQDTKLDMKPFVVSLDLGNELRLYNASLNSNAHMKLEPFMADLKGKTEGTYREHTVKHCYQIKYADMAVMMEYSTSGNVMDAHFSHQCQLEFTRPSSKSSCIAQIDSQSFHLGSNVHAVVLPFRLTVDAFISGDGEINLYGKHAGRFYRQLLVKAEPLVLGYLHESRLLTTHQNSSTYLNNRLEGLLKPGNQSLMWTMKSSLNKHVYNHTISAYNNPGKFGLEFSGDIYSDIFNMLSKGQRSAPRIKEFSIFGFLKYDKNSSCHILQTPFPRVFKQVKNVCLYTLETLQQFIRRLKIQQLGIEFRDKLDQFQKKVSVFMQHLHLENKMNNMKAKVDYLIAEFSVTLDDLELAINNLTEYVEERVLDVRHMILTVRRYVDAGLLTDKVANVLIHIGNQLHTVNEKFVIKASLVKALEIIEDIIRWIDLHTLADGSGAWLKRLDFEYGFLEKVKGTLSQVKQAIDKFDLKMFFKYVSVDIQSKISNNIEQLLYDIPSSKIAQVIESMNDVIINWIDEYEVADKVNAVYFYFRDLICKYSLDDKLKGLMNQLVLLIKALKFEQTVQSAVKVLKSINLEFVNDTITEFLQRATDQLRVVDIQEITEAMNGHVSSLFKSIKDFDYNVFVDDANRRFAKLTKYINEQIQIFELVQKLEVVRNFIREIQNAIFQYVDQLKTTTVAEALRRLKGVIDTTFYNDIKMKVMDILNDIRQRVLGMDLREEMHIHLQRACDSYRNMVTFISVKINLLFAKISQVLKDNETFNQIRDVVDGVLDVLKRADVNIPSFTLPLTDLVIPTFQFSLSKLQHINIPAELSLPRFTVLGCITIPAITISFDEIRASVVAIIDDIRGLEIQTIDPIDIFGDLKVLYLFALPDVTFPEISLSELRIPAVSIPKLKLKDFEMTTFRIPEISLPQVPDDMCIPFFGKLHGGLEVNSPLYTLVTVWMIENVTVTPTHPRFTATLTSYVQSPIKLLEYTFESTAQLDMSRFIETVRMSHVAFSLHHEASLVQTGPSADFSINTSRSYAVYLVNNRAAALNRGISAKMYTAYSHSFDIPSMDISSQASVKQDVAATVQSSRITVSGHTTASAKWSIQQHTNEGAHKSNVEFKMDFGTAKIAFGAETECKSLKLKQTLKAETVSLRNIVVEARFETEAPLVKQSVMCLIGEAHMGDHKVALRAYHDSELTGTTTGFLSNSVEFLAHPYEIVLDIKTKVNVRMFFPLNLTGRVDVQHDYNVILNSKQQRTFWFILAGFNQYSYNHNVTFENNEMAIMFDSSANGHANLDFLTVPLSVPEMTVQYLDIRTPEVRDLSLWEHTGFKTLLTTPRQSFDMILKLHYYKYPERHKMALPLEPVYAVVSDTVSILRATLQRCRDKAVALLQQSFNQEKSQYDKHKTNTSSLSPTILTVLGYKTPSLNKEVSSLRTEMPAIGFFVPKEISKLILKIASLDFLEPSNTLMPPTMELPLIHIPENLSDRTVADIQNSMTVPVLGNLTCDFSFKSPVITISASTGVYN